MTRRWIALLGTVILLSATVACTDPRVVKRINPSPMTTMNLEYVPWCDDELGASLIYPCKWDSRIRPVGASWAPGQFKVAVWVRRSTGCPQPLPENTTCFWAPADQ